MPYTRCVSEASFDRSRPHPWHGLPVGSEPPRLVDAYIEITPNDGVKYEIDKLSGYLRVDRPQGSAALPPTLYGFIPRTYCGLRVAELTPAATQGDGDPLDICVLSQQRIERAEIIVPARVLGGVRLLDEGEADDKIIAVLDSDPVFKYAKDLRNLPDAVVNRIVHYFGTYKLEMTADAVNPIEVVETYGAEEAQKVIAASMEDYNDKFPAVDRRRSTD